MLGIGINIRHRFGSAPKFTFTCTTTGAETLTLTRVDLAAGKSCVIDWGDGTSNTYDSSNNGSTKTKAYAGTGTYTVKISNPKEFTIFDLRDNKAVLNSNQFKLCGANLVTLYIFKSAGVGSVFNTDDIKHLNLTTTLYLYYSSAGTYKVDTADITAMRPTSIFNLFFGDTGTYKVDTADITLVRPTNTFQLHFTSTGTYKVDTADITLVRPTSVFYLQFNSTGTYKVDTADITLVRPTSRFNLYFSQTGTYIYNSDDVKLIKPTADNIVTLNTPTTTITRLHYAGQTNIATFRRWLSLDQTKVTDILLGLYDAFSSKTNTGGTINVAGTGATANASPTGTLQANPDCGLDPTGKEAAHELVNDGCGRSANHWTSVTIN